MLNMKAFTASTGHEKEGQLWITFRARGTCCSNPCGGLSPGALKRSIDSNIRATLRRARNQRKPLRRMTAAASRRGYCGKQDPQKRKKLSRKFQARLHDGAAKDTQSCCRDGLFWKRDQPRCDTPIGSKVHTIRCFTGPEATRRAAFLIQDPSHFAHISRSHAKSGTLLMELTHLSSWASALGWRHAS